MHMQLDADKWSPLHYAALAGWTEGIQLLLQACTKHMEGAVKKLHLRRHAADDHIVQAKVGCHKHSS